MAEEGAKPTLHHMNNSQSQRILWLLCELSTPYNLTLHARKTTGREKHRAPPELAAIHPMGKSPILVTAEGRIIVESSAIATYLISTYDTTNKFKGNEKNDWIKDEILSSFAGSSLGPITTLQLTCDILVGQTPFFLRPLTRLLTGGMWNAFLGPEMKKQLKYLDGQLDGQDYFMGDDPGRADFMLSWPLDMVAQRGWLGDLSDYPRLKEWRERCLERPGWKEGMKKGNGYDLNGLGT